MDHKNIDNNIKILRLINDSMSQQTLSELVGCTRQTIISIEQNKYNPSLLLSAKIANVFNVTIEEVFTINFKE